MTKDRREIFSFSQENEENKKKIHFRRIRHKRASKKLWLLFLMAVALGYLFITLNSRF